MYHYIGIDVSKATLQVHIPLLEEDLLIENSSSALSDLYQKVKSIEDLEAVFVYESTGSYSTLLEAFCQRKKVKCFKVGAYQSASFSKTIKNRNKTDKVDAKMLSAMQILAKSKDIKVPYRDKSAHKLRSFIKYYQSLNKEKVRAKNYLEGATHNLEDSFVLNRIKRKIKQIDVEISEVIEKCLVIIKANAEYYEAFNNIISIKGVGEKSGIILLYLFLRYPNTNRQQLTALCGLDPVVVESGSSVKKQSRISKQGLSLVRSILYTPILSTVRYNDEMKSFYEALVDRGKPKRLAQIAVMRKIVLLAHSLYKNNQSYNPYKYLENIEGESKMDS